MLKPMVQTKSFFATFLEFWGSLLDLSAHPVHIAEDLEKDLQELMGDSAREAIDGDWRRVEEDLARAMKSFEEGGMPGPEQEKRS